MPRLRRLRRFWKRAVAKRLVSVDKSVLDHLLCEIWIWRNLGGELLGTGRFWELRSHLLRHRLLPFEMRQFRNHLDPVIADRAQLFLQLDLRALQASHTNAALESKSGFSQACAEHNLPHIPTILLPEDRKIEAWQDHLAFVKPDCANRARGCAVLSALGPTEYSVKSQRAEVRGSLAAVLGGHCPGERLVIQPMLKNAPAIAALVGRIPLTIRAITGRTDRGWKILSALAEIPLDEELPLAAKWAIVPISLTDGKISPFEFPEPAEVQRHPVTGARIAGSILPKWRSIVELVERAHRLIAAEMPTVGWDVALTPDEPVLIEANRDWAVAPHSVNSSGFDLTVACGFKQFAKQF